MWKWDFRAGFTLIELSLSIAFISVLSITVVLLINQTVAAYNRGILLDQVNTTGVDLVDEFRYAVQNSASRSVVDECSVYYHVNDNNDAPSAYKDCVNDGAHKFVSILQYSDNVSNGKANIGRVPIFGAFCTGTYSYIWNSGYLYNGANTALESSRASVKYKASGSGGERTASGFRILKIRDDSRAVCVSAVRSKGGDNNYNVTDFASLFDITGYEVVSEEPVDLLPDAQNNLILYDLSAARPVSSNASNSIFYAVSFILGTIRGGININKSGDYCAPPGDGSGVNDFDYCAINKFNFAIQATGE